MKKAKTMTSAVVSVIGTAAAAAVLVLGGNGSAAASTPPVVSPTPYVTPPQSVIPSSPAPTYNVLDWVCMEDICYPVYR
jgi:hypothetical protein